MADEFPHTSFDEQEDFLKLSTSQQNLKLYMSLRESNGHVADLFERIRRAEESLASMGKEIQNVRVFFSEHVTAHAPRMDSQIVRDLTNQHRDMWSVWRFSRWFIPISIPASIMVVTSIAELIRYWR